MDIINNIILKSGRYKESSLVDMICTEAQKRAYHKKEKFPNGKSRDTFLDRLSYYCEFEPVPNTDKYNIRVFTHPKTRAEKALHKGIYQYLTPLLLDEIINSEHGRESIFTVYQLIKSTHMTNSNYYPCKFAQSEVSCGLQIPHETVSDYFDKTDYSINYRIKQCLSYLTQTGCIFFHETYLVKTIEFVSVTANLNGVKTKGKSNIHKASKDELTLYAQLLELADKELDIKSNQERWFSKKANNYNHLLSYLLREHNIAYFTKGFEVYRIHKERCQNILDSFKDRSLDECKREIGNILKLNCDHNAANRLNKNPPTYDENYLDNFKNLSGITLPYGTEDIIKQFPAIKQSHVSSADKQAQRMMVDFEEV